MSKCPFCDAKNDSNNNFCEKCGEAFYAECSCGNTCDLEAVFCGACGKKFEPK
jgi:hypothetical protein